MNYAARERLAAELETIREQGLYKTERVITTPQSASIETNGLPTSVTVDDRSSSVITNATSASPT